MITNLLFFKEGDMLNWTIFEGKTQFQKMWLSLGKRAQLDLRSTKCIADVSILESSKVFECAII